MALGLAALGLAVLSGCTTAPPAPPDPAIQMPRLEARIAELIAHERKAADSKAKPLAVDQKLTEIARRRSAEMAKANRFNTSDDPHASATMLMDADADFQGLIGENVAAQHYAPKDGIDVEAFAKRFVEGWTASKPHRENFSFPDYDRTGVGAAVNADTIYVAQIFTTDLGFGRKTEKGTSDVTALPSAKEGKAEAAKPAPPALRGAIGGSPPTPGAQQKDSAGNATP